MAGKEIEVGGKLYLLPDANIARSNKQAKLERQAIYLQWVCLPRDERDPPTKKAMAERMEVSLQTLLNWERDPAFSDEVRRRLGRAFKIDRLSTVFEALYQTATEPENPRQVQAARALFEWLGQTQEGEGTSDLAQFTDAELERLAEGDG